MAGVLRLGFLAAFISEPVLKGFIVGLALTIIAGQLPKLFGVPKGGDDFFAQIVPPGPKSRRHPGGEIGGGDVLSLGIVLGLRRWLPIVPGSLVAVLLGVAAVSVLGLADKGVAIVGEIDVRDARARCPGRRGWATT